MTRSYLPSHCYGNAIAFGQELSGRLFDEWWETIPKRKRTRALRQAFLERLDKEILVVHGSVVDNFNHRFVHAWIEHNGVVYDPTFSVIASATDWYTPGNRFPIALPLPLDMPPPYVGSAELQAKYPLIVAVRTCFRHTQGPWLPEEVEWST